MSKRTHQEIRNALLKALSDGKAHSYGDLERRVNTNWKTIRQHCDDLKLFKLITSPGGSIKITKQGLNFLKKNSSF